MRRSVPISPRDPAGPGPLAAAKARARRRIDVDRRRYPEDLGPVFEALADGLFDPDFNPKKVAPVRASRHRFRLVVGTTPTSYRDQHRLETTLDLVCRSSLPMAEIAAGLGFDDLVPFRKWFKYRTGMAPTTMRAGVQPEPEPESPAAPDPAAPDPGDATDPAADEPWTLRWCRQAVAWGVAPKRGAALIRKLRDAYPELDDEPPSP